MKPADIRKLSPEEIDAKLMDAREELMRLRFQFATGELTDHTRLSQTRKEIARFLTILTELEMSADVEGEG
jgi:large subunit ribosomal protein L29